MPPRTRLECCRKAKASRLIKRILGDGITKQEELFIYGWLQEVLVLSCSSPAQDQPLTMSIGSRMRRWISGRRQRYHRVESIWESVGYSVSPCEPTLEILCYARIILRGIDLEI